MPRFWISHWQNKNWRPDVNDEGEPLLSSGSNSFRKRGVSKGDLVYIVSIYDGSLYLGGRMIVRKILNRSQIAELYPSDSRYDADEWIVDQDSGTPLHLHRRLSPTLTKTLRFRSPSGVIKPPAFATSIKLDNQATRGIREITIESARMFDQIIEVTDQSPKYDRVLTVTQSMIESASTMELLPDEIYSSETLKEGSRYQVLVNAVERNPEARRKCIATYGTTCCICGFNFGEVYGPEAAGFIHVHHINPISESSGEYAIDPIKDLRPVCPNCHAVLHLNKRIRTIDEVKEMLSSHRNENSGP